MSCWERLSMRVRKYYVICIEKLRIIERVKFNSISRGGFDSFFYSVSKHLSNGCRGPPFINLFLKKFKLIGGKKDGRTPKEKKI